ncbi:unnamed protein product [Blepharisma stoltei]|uniref:Uncharacterized protein n=1 Tax=Blepharisma stoltei TaxID=1481888 RepID=A0AAU9K990_9CILI|nr:unnamed protein product [Blepharisma stoltei]
MMISENPEILPSKRNRSVTPRLRRKPLRALSQNLSNKFDDPDLKDCQNPHSLPYYACEIFDNLHKSETKFMVNPSYMDLHTEINYKMRAILIDWLVIVHYKFKFTPETLFITVNILDRYLSLKNVSKHHLQLVGVTSLFIASKYEEIHPPAISNLVALTDNAYTKEQIIEMEGDILRALDFQITNPSVLRFFERMHKLALSDLAFDNIEMYLGRYLIELSLIEYFMLKYKPSLIAASAVYLSRKLLNIQPAWNPILDKHSRTDENLLKQCAKDLFVLFQSAQYHSLTSIREKYSKIELMEVSQLKVS